MSPKKKSVQAKKKARAILLVHGWNAGPGEFRALSKALKRRGRVVKTLGYPSEAWGADRIVREKLRPFLRKNPDADLITHSTGGPLARMAGQNNDLLKGRRVLMVAPAIGGSYLSNLNKFLRTTGTGGIKSQPLLRWLNVNNEERNSVKPLKGVDIGVLAGTYKAKKNKQLKMYLRFCTSVKDVREGDVKKRDSLLGRIYDTPGDGVVKLEHTRLPEESRRLELPFSHSRLIQDDKAIKVIADYMDEGVFAKTAALKRGPGIYIGARNLNHLNNSMLRVMLPGKHHFYVMIPKNPGNFKGRLTDLGGGVRGVVMGAYKGRAVGKKGLYTEIANTVDTAAARDWFNHSDANKYDPEVHRIDIQGKGLDKTIHVMLRMRDTYEKNIKRNPVEYNFAGVGGLNSNAWVQSLGEYAGLKRRKKEFDGIDLAADLRVPEEYFKGEVETTEEENESYEVKRDPGWEGKVADTFTRYLIKADQKVSNA